MVESADAANSTPSVSAGRHCCLGLSINIRDPNVSRPSPSEASKRVKWRYSPWRISGRASTVQLDYRPPKSGPTTRRGILAGGRQHRARRRRRCIPRISWSPRIPVNCICGYVRIRLRPRKRDGGRLSCRASLRFTYRRTPLLRLSSPKDAQNVRDSASLMLGTTY